MQWKDEAFLLSKNNYGENSIIIEIFTLNHGKCSGIVYGGTSKKIKNYLQLGNKIHVNLTTKNDSRLGYFKVEIIDAIDSIAPAAPKRCPVIDLVELIFILYACSLNTFSIANISLLSPRGVDVPCTLI